MTRPHYLKPSNPPFRNVRLPYKKPPFSSTPVYVTRGALARALSTICLHLCIGGVDPRPFVKMAAFRVGVGAAPATSAVPGSMPAAVQASVECKQPGTRKDQSPEVKEPIPP